MMHQRKNKTARIILLGAGVYPTSEGVIPQCEAVDLRGAVAEARPQVFDPP